MHFFSRLRAGDISSRDTKRSFNPGLLPDFAKAQTKVSRNKSAILKHQGNEGKDNLSFLSWRTFLKGKKERQKVMVVLLL